MHLVACARNAQVRQELGPYTAAASLQLALHGDLDLTQEMALEVGWPAQARIASACVFCVCVLFVPKAWPREADPLWF